MENQSTEEHASTKGQSPKSGTMTFIDHLDELRRRLIRFLIVMTLCVLATYGFRKEILDLIRAPVDAPLKKYTANQQLKTVKPGQPGIPLTTLNSYNCSCLEIPVKSVVAENEEKATAMASGSAEGTVNDISADASTKQQLTDLAETAEDWLEVAKNTINDFVIFFQVAVGKDPSPVFESEKYQLSQQEAENDQAFQPLADHLNLNCQCELAGVSNKEAAPHSSMVFIGLPELFFAQMKVAIFAGFFLCFPYLLIELWGFVGPALYRSEKKVFWIFSIFSFIFFIGGALFGYFVVFPYGFDFFLSLTQMGEIMPSLSVGEYLSFALKLLMAFGFIFELPLVTFILARMGVVTPELMIKQSRVAILIVFILSAVLTPPDPFTMVLMAGPLIILYIISIGVCFLGVNRKKAALRMQGIDPDEFEE